MKKNLSLFLSAFLALSLVSCGPELPVTDQSDDPSAESTAPSKEEDKLSTYPLHVDQKYLDIITNFPKIIFTTTAEENGLANNIYSFSGTVTEAGVFDEGTSYIIVSTDNGPVLVGNLYKTIYEQAVKQYSSSELALLDLDDVNDYVFPAVGETANLICTYQGFSDTFNMPAFYLGANEVFFQDSDDSGSGNGATDTEPTKPSEPERATEPEPSTEPKPSTEPEPQPSTPTVSQKNALSTAKRYLKAMAFSRSGLIKQLEYEGYNAEDATYGADNCGADWMEQAVKKAKSYLDTMAFSRSGLIEQLKYEGFTSEQATYAADNCLADWMEQVVDKAKSYLDVMPFSRSGLISQLEYEGYSADEATYGADNCGADWMEQAVKKAKSYLDLMSFSRSQLIDQLEYDEFTHEQAVYGVEKNGL